MKTFQELASQLLAAIPTTTELTSTSKSLQENQERTLNNDIRLITDSDGNIDLTGIVPTDLDSDLSKPKSDFEIFRRVLSGNYNADYMSVRTANYEKAEMIYSKVLSLGWNSKQFAKHLEAFLLRCKYPTFTIADFFQDITTLKLKSYGAYLIENDKTAGAINNSILWFKMLNSDFTGTTGYWIDKFELSEYQINFLREKERAGLEFLARQEQQFEAEKRKQERLAQAEIKQLPGVDAERTVKKLLNDFTFFTELLEKYNRLILIHAEHPETLSNANEHYQADLKQFIEKRAETTFKQLETPNRGNLQLTD